MHNFLKSGSWNVICDVCGKKFKAEQVQKRWDGLMVCKTDFEMRHPSDFLRVQREKISVPYARHEAEDTFIRPYSGYLCSISEGYPQADIASADCAKLGWGTINTWSGPEYPFVPPPAVPTDPAFSFVRLLIHGSGTNGQTTFTDTSQRAVTVTRVGSAQVSTATQPYGSGSLALNGTTDALSCAYDLETNVFFQFNGAGYATVEFWIKSTGAGTFPRILERADAGTTAGSWYIYTNESVVGDVAFVFAPFSTATPLLKTPTAVLADGLWHHVAITRNVNSWNLWVDGTSRASATLATNTGAPTTPLLIGKAISLSRWLNGNLADIRFTGADPLAVGASVACRYTGTFTPPSAPFPDS